MADPAQLNLAPRGGEMRLRALLEDVVDLHKGVYPQYRLALAVWFDRAAGASEHKLLELFTIPGRDTFATSRFSLLWKIGSNEPPFVKVSSTSVEHFENLVRTNKLSLSPFLHNAEVLYFDKSLLTPAILETFGVQTEPPGFIKGWYLDRDEYGKKKTLRNLLSYYGSMKPHIGLVKTEESQDFENCRGPLHVEVNQRWLPLSEGGLRNHAFFNDLQDGRPGYLLFQGGSLYQILKFEIRTVPEYSTRVLEPPRDGRYAEVYLRSVPPTE